MALFCCLLYCFFSRSLCSNYENSLSTPLQSFITFLKRLSFLLAKDVNFMIIFWVIDISKSHVKMSVRNRCLIHPVFCGAAKFRSTYNVYRQVTENSIGNGEVKMVFFVPPEIRLCVIHPPSAFLVFPSTGGRNARLRDAEVSSSCDWFLLNRTDCVAFSYARLD